MEVSTPQGSGPRPHVHEREDEALYVLEGSHEVTVGNDRFDAREGHFIFAPRGIPHGYVVRAAPARHLGFVFPSGWADVLPRYGPGDGRRGSGSSGVRRVGEGARRHVARPAACSVSAVGMTAPPRDYPLPGVDSAAVSRSVTLNEPGPAAGSVGRQSGLTAR